MDCSILLIGSLMFSIADCSSLNLSKYLFASRSVLVVPRRVPTRISFMLSMIAILVGS